MNTGERFRKYMKGKDVDRVPLLEEGIRDDVLELWRNQGHLTEESFADIFHFDQRFDSMINLDPIPDLKKWPRTYADLQRFAAHMHCDYKKRLPPNWPVVVKKKEKNDTLHFMRIHDGFFLSMGVYGWDRFLEVIYLLQDEPELVKECMNIQARLSRDMLLKMAEETKIDAVIFSEPIGGNDRPLLSPEMYQEFVLDSYGPLFSAIESLGIESIIFRTYANARHLLPILCNTPFNCLWACETNIDAMDYRDIQKEFGHCFSLIGGIDLDAIRRGKKAIDAELESKVPGLLENGTYIPMADGRIRTEISFENYYYYRSRLEEIISHYSR